MKFSHFLFYKAFIGFLAVMILIFGAMEKRALQAALYCGLTSYRTLILDAGHGGEDGGAVSVTGALESQLNLSITKRARDLLGFYGISALLTREEDVSLHDASAKSLREKKIADLKFRVNTVQTSDTPLLISIHQNTFQDTRYSGAQVFYAPTNGSADLAEHMQKTLKTALDPSNGRSAKQIADSVYLMNHITCPAILIECGFLTNPEEEARLRSDSYQKKIAAGISSALLTLSEIAKDTTGA